MGWKLQEWILQLWQKHASAKPCFKTNNIHVIMEMEYIYFILHNP